MPPHYPRFRLNWLNLRYNYVGERKSIFFLSTQQVIYIYRLYAMELYGFGEMYNFLFSFQYDYHREFAYSSLVATQWVKGNRKINDETESVKWKREYSKKSTSAKREYTTWRGGKFTGKQYIS